MEKNPVYRTDGAAVYCPECDAKFGGMIECPWCEIKLLPLPDADPIAVEFYRSINEAYDGKLASQESATSR